MSNYPIFRAPDNVWNDIKSKIQKKEKKHGIYSRFLYYKKIAFWAWVFIVLFLVIWLFYSKENLNNKVTNSSYLNYINQVDDLTNAIQNSLEKNIAQLNQL